MNYPAFIRHIEHSLELT